MKQKLLVFLKKWPGVYSVIVHGFAHSALQFFKCVCGAWTRVHSLSAIFTKLGTSYLHCTLVWFYHKTKYLLPSPGPILALPSIDKLTCLHPTRVQRPVGRTVQIIPGLHRIRSIIDMRQVRKHLDSTIFKVLTIIKWGIVTMLNKKLLEKQRYRIALLPMRYT